MSRSTLAMIGMVAIAASTLIWRLNAEGSGVEIGDTAPEYVAPSLSGGEVSFSDARGDVVLVNVWATWCGPCRVEMPSIEALHQRYSDRGLTVLAVSVDTGPGHRRKVEHFVEELGLSFTVLLDPESRISRVLRTAGLPETFVLDGEGRIVKRVIGASNWDSDANRALIEALLAG